MTTITTSHYTISLTGGNDEIATSLSTKQTELGIDEVHLEVVPHHAHYPVELTLTWVQPAIDIHSYWRPGADRDHRFVPDWGRGFEAKATSQAPVACLHSLGGQNKLTFALSDALNTTLIQAGLREETASFQCSVTMFVEPWLLQAPYRVTLRLDTRPLPFAACLDDVQAWWAAMPGYEPAPVPDIARLPMYSTWYSFHQDVDPAAIEAECARAKALGCEAVIVDDGWQTVNNERGYAYCGDWRPAPEKIPDMQAHVARVHALGMKYLLWYSVPFVGPHSDAWAQFHDKMLSTPDIGGAKTGILDPRYADVREYLIQTYERGLREWDLDGFKLDFVDSFRLEPDKRDDTGDGRDYVAVPEAVNRLLSDVLARLRAIKPDIMIEFRQSYIGPLMRTYGNMFRAGDCPNDSVENRVRTIDVRLLCGSTAAHADPLMWHPDEPVASAAQQILCTLFAVPQISVRLDRLPPAHLAMLRFWLGFWREHRAILMDGMLDAAHPEALYPIITASDDATAITVVYQDIVARPVEQMLKQWIVVNATPNERVVVELGTAYGRCRVEVQDCSGTLVRSASINFGKGLHHIDVPSAGLVTITRGREPF